MNIEYKTAPPQAERQGVGMDDDAMQPALGALHSDRAQRQGVGTDDDAMQLSPGAIDSGQADRPLSSSTSDAGGPNMDLGKVSQDNVLFHEYCSEFERGLLLWAQHERNNIDKDVWLKIKSQLLDVQISLVERRCGATQDPLTPHLDSMRQLGACLFEAEKNIRTDVKSFVRFRTGLFAVVSMHYGLQLSLEPADRVIPQLISQIDRLRKGWGLVTGLTQALTTCKRLVSKFFNPLTEKMEELKQSVGARTISADAMRILLREECRPLFKNLKDKIDNMLADWESNGLACTYSAQFALIIFGLSAIGYEYCRSKAEMPDLHVHSKLSPDGTPSYNNIALYRDVLLWGDLLRRESAAEANSHRMDHVEHITSRWDKICQTMASVLDRDACAVVEFSDNASEALDRMVTWAYGLRVFYHRVFWLFPAFQAPSFLRDVYRLDDVFFCRGHYNPHFDFNECVWTLCRVLADFQIAETQFQTRMPPTKIDVEILRLGKQTGGWCRFVKDLILGFVRKEVRALGVVEGMQKIVDCLIGASLKISSGGQESWEYNATISKIKGLPGHLKEGGASRVFYKIAEIENNLREPCKEYRHRDKANFDTCKDLWSLAACCECFLDLNTSMNQNRTRTGSVLFLDGNGPTKFNWLAELRQGNKELKDWLQRCKSDSGQVEEGAYEIPEVWSAQVRPRLSRTIELLS